jgi:hypothetical protein
MRLEELGIKLMYDNISRFTYTKFLGAPELFRINSYTKSRNGKYGMNYNNYYK